jgi:casein kinase I family protein HRR25
VNVLVMDRNSAGIRGVQFEKVLVDILKIL